jgi:hypothetical protein
LEAAIFSEMSAHFQDMALHAKKQQSLSNVKFTLVPGTEVKKPARKAMRFNSGL